MAGGAESGDPSTSSATVVGDRGDDAVAGDPAANAEITVSHFYSRSRTRRRPSRYAL